MAERNPILTIGHSKHTLQRFVALLQRARVNTVADVRSAPVSRFLPHFNKDRLAASLAECGVAYVFLGKDLGGRPERPDLFTGGVADYEKMAQIPSFRSGLERLVAGAKHHRIAAMCAEADPLDCHRCLLVCRALAAESMDVGHILASGAIVAMPRSRAACSVSPALPMAICSPRRALSGWHRPIAPAPPKPPIRSGNRLSARGPEQRAGIDERSVRVSGSARGEAVEAEARAAARRRAVSRDRARRG